MRSECLPPQHQAPGAVLTVGWCTSAGYEVVEEDGFTFKRQKAAPAGTAENDQPNQICQPVSCSAAAQQPSAQSWHQVQTPGRQAAAQQLAALCSSLCALEAAHGSAALSTVADDIAAMFGTLVVQEAEQGCIQVAARAPQRTVQPREPAAAPSYVDLASRKAGLVARLAAFEKVGGVGWGGQDKGPSTAVGGARPCQPGRQGFALCCPLPRPAILVVVQEEAEWLALLGKAEQLGLEAAAPEGCSSAAAAQQPPAEAPALEQLHSDAVRQLAMQVTAGSA